MLHVGFQIKQGEKKEDLNLPQSGTAQPPSREPKDKHPQNKKRERERDRERVWGGGERRESHENGRDGERETEKNSRLRAFFSQDADYFPGW